MKVVSWNVNGLRAAVRKEKGIFFHEIDADFFALQEIKMQEGQLTLELEGYEQYYYYADKKGYSGTAIFTKHTPLAVYRGMDEKNARGEGRVLTLEYETFYIVNAYVPNAKRDLSRLTERLAWEDELRTYLLQLDAKKPVIYVGDLNVAHQAIDIKNDKSNRGNSGFTDEERAKMTQLLDSGFTDSYRHFYRDEEKYSWWSYMNKARDRNIGWRIDYILVSDRLVPLMEDASIHTDVYGSDHCPVSLTIRDTIFDS